MALDYENEEFKKEVHTSYKRALDERSLHILQRSEGQSNSTVILCVPVDTNCPSIQH